MSADLVMPRVSDTMEDGVVVRWLRENGDHVREGEPVVEIETDKATTELVAPAEGDLHVLVQAGATADVGSVLAYVGEADARPAPPDASSLAPNRSGDGAVPASRRDAQGISVVAAGTQAPNRGAGQRRVRATPLARRLAAEAGVDIRAIAPGSGPMGRVHKHDVERFLANPLPTRVMTNVGAESPGRGPGRAEVDVQDEIVPLSRMDAAIARRMSQAKQEIPHYYLTTHVDVSRAETVCAELGSGPAPLHVTITDIVVLSCARALRAVPQVNAQWTDGGIRRRGEVDIGLAVAVAGNGLLVPVLRNVDQTSVAALVAARGRIVSRARAGSLARTDPAGAALTVSNLGMYGISEFHAIIDPSGSGIVAVGAIEKRVVAFGDRPVVRSMVTISLSADHRVYSGATAAKFLAVVKNGIEWPTRSLAGPIGPAPE